MVFSPAIKHLLNGSSKFLHRNFSINLSEEHLSLKWTCRRFAEMELKPIAAKLDKEHKFPAEQIIKMGKLGLLSIHVPEEWGGCGQDMLSLAVVVEEIARCCAGTAAIISIHNTLYANLLNKWGSEEQKKEFLCPFTRGTLGCFALSEPDAGSDVMNLSTFAKSNGNNYILNGTKAWVTSGMEAKAAIIFATIDPRLKHEGITAFLVPLPTSGLIFGKKEDKMGIRASSTCNFVLENVVVPRENIIGQIGQGFKIAMTQLDQARVGIAAQALGIAQAALEIAVQYAAVRKSSGQPLNTFQAVKIRIADMATRLEAARLLVWKAAIICNKSERTTKQSSIAKLVASETATFITHGAIQMLGGMGYVSDMPVERHYRDARVTEIYGGVSDIQRLIIGDLIIKEYGGC